MIKNIVSRSKFAQMCGVSPAAVTTALKNALSDAGVDTRIDAAHPLAVKYIEDKTTLKPQKSPNGMDSLYDEALVICVEKGKISANHLKAVLKIGQDRATRLARSMKINEVDLQKIELAPQSSDAGIPGSEYQSEQPQPSSENVVQFKKKNENKVELIDLSEIEIPENIVEFLDMTLRDLIEQFGTDERFKLWLEATRKIEVIDKVRLDNAQTKGTLISRKLVKVGVIDVIETANIRLMRDGSISMAKRVSTMVQAGSSVKEVENYLKKTIGSFIGAVKDKMTRALRDA